MPREAPVRISVRRSASIGAGIVDLSNPEGGDPVRRAPWTRNTSPLARQAVAAIRGAGDGGHIVAPLIRRLGGHS